MGRVSSVAVAVRTATATTSDRWLMARRGKKLSVSELLRLACVYAELDRESWLHAMANCRGPEDAAEVSRIEAFVAQLREYRLRRWGKTRLEAVLEEANAVDVADVIAKGLKDDES